MNFPSKILLIGEYSLVAGGSGLAMPYARYSGKLSFEEGITALQSNQSLKLLLHYLENRLVPVNLRLDQFNTDLDQGLWFDSNIPNGYGLGSSGALIAAIYHRYHQSEKSDLSEIRNELAAMESFFHGSSSGIDPLVSYIQKPVIVKKDQVAAMDNWSSEQLGFSVYLVDTGLKSKTISLVDWFKTRMLKQSFSEATMHDYMLPNEAVMGSIEKNEAINFQNLLEISRYQLEYLSPMVTDSFRKHFFAGLENGEFIFKLCGSGGGGFMLCWAKNAKMAEEYMIENQLRFELVFLGNE